MFRRTKKFLKDNEGPLALGAGVFIGASVVIAYPKFFMDTTAFYNPKQPIPGFGLNEESIVRNAAVGWIASEFLAKKELTDEFTEFAGEVVQNAVGILAEKSKQV